MKLLITGAWRATPEQLAAIRELGHEIIWHQQEKEPLPCPPSAVEGIIGNGIFLAHPIEKFNNLRYIQLTSAGYDRVPMEYVKSHSIAIYNARGVYSIPMAEHTLAGVLAIYRKLNNFAQFQRAHRWEKQRDLPELCGKRVLILGCGSVGTECAKRFQAFGCQVTGLDLSPRSEVPGYDNMASITELSKFLPTAEILVVTLPKTAETVDLLGADELKLLPTGALICNIARGGIINASALEQELVAGRLAADLDVFETEPLAPDSKLWDLPNVLITPHNSFVSNGNGERLYQVIMKNLKTCE